MTPATRTKKTSTRAKLLAFAPALLAIGATAFVASGVSLVPGATASTVSVSGTVTTSLASDPTIPVDTGCPGASGGTSATATAFPAGWESTPSFIGGSTTTKCTIQFEGNTRAEVLFKNDFAGDAKSFCNDPDGAGAAARSCASGGVSDVGGGGTLTGSDQFGIALSALSGPAAAGASMAAPAASNASANMWRPVPTNAAAGTRLCATAAANVGTPALCSFALGVNGTGGTQPSGTYSAVINFTTIAY